MPTGTFGTSDVGTVSAALSHRTQTLQNLPLSYRVDLPSGSVTVSSANWTQAAGGNVT